MELARRLLHHEITSHDPGDVMGDIFKCWFLEPVRTESMKVGSQNETKVLAALPREFNNLVSEWALSSKSQITFQWVDAIDVGLLCLKNARYIGTSVDKLALICCIEVPPEMHTHPRRLSTSLGNTFLCSHEGCEASATHNFPSQNVNIPRLCEMHKLEGMIQIPISTTHLDDNSCYACHRSCTFQYSIFACLKGACDAHRVTGMTPIFPSQNTIPFVPPSKTLTLMCVEVKTMTKETTVQPEVHLQEQYGKFIHCDIVTQNDLFRAAIPKPAHRVQCVHHIIATDTKLCLYVVSDTGRLGILRMVLLYVNDAFNGSYLAMFKRIVDKYLPWVYGSPRTAVPEFTEEQLGYLKTNEVLLYHFHLWSALMHYVTNKGPIPNVQAVLPSMVALWNLVKNGGDLYSALLNHIKPIHVKLNGKGKVYCEASTQLFIKYTKQLEFGQPFRSCLTQHTRLNYTQIFKQWSQILCPSFANWCGILHSK